MGTNGAEALAGEFRQLLGFREMPWSQKKRQINGNGESNDRQKSGDYQGESGSISLPAFASVQRFGVMTMPDGGEDVYHDTRHDQGNPNGEGKSAVMLGNGHIIAVRHFTQKQAEA